MNRVILIGNLTRDPELTTTTSGVSICRFSLAVSRRYTNSEGERETDFINVVVWRGLAENCHKFLRKGSKAAVVGTLQTRTYDAQDGTKRYVTEVVADEVEFVGARANADDQIGGEDQANGGDNAGDGGATKLTPIQDDSLPF